MERISIRLTGVFILLIFLLGFLGYFSFFKSINFIEKEMGPFTVAYIEYTGPYQEAEAIMEEVCNHLLADEITLIKEFGVFYDNPREVRESELRSMVGCIIEGEDIKKISNSSEKYQIQVIPKKLSVLTEFPYKNQMSILFGVMKIYPALEEYLIENEYVRTPIMEIYDLQNGKITYLTEVAE